MAKQVVEFLSYTHNPEYKRKTIIYIYDIHHTGETDVFVISKIHRLTLIL